MNTKIAVLIFGLALMFSTSSVLAQDTDESDEMEATMRLMSHAEAELPAAVIKKIELPDSLLTRDPDSPAIDNKGHQTANDRRLNNENRLGKAAEALEHAAEMAGQAQENAENRGRSEDRPDPPEPPGTPPGQN